MSAFSVEKTNLFRRGLAYFLLAFALLFAQQGGFAHELSHFARAQTGKQVPHSPACEQCGAYSQVGAGAVSHIVPFALPTLPATVYVFRGVVHATPRFFHRLSRGPPLLA
jgi:hypothetical protein